MNLIRNIEIIRKQKGYSQEYIAQNMHVDNAVISNIEKGKRKLKWDEIEIFSNIFEMSILDLITYPEVYVKKDAQMNILTEPLEEYGLNDKEKLIKTLYDRINYQEKIINALLKIEL
jgi:transcriptional regulator with XRE-family HTH domain